MASPRSAVRRCKSALQLQLAAPTPHLLPMLQRQASCPVQNVAPSRARAYAAPRNTRHWSQQPRTSARESVRVREPQLTPRPPPHGFAAATRPLWTQARPQVQQTRQDINERPGQAVHPQCLRARAPILTTPSAAPINTQLPAIPCTVITTHQLSAMTSSYPRPPCSGSSCSCYSPWHAATAAALGGGDQLLALLLHGGLHPAAVLLDQLNQLVAGLHENDKAEGMWSRQTG